MKYGYNEPAYYIPYVRFTQDYPSKYVGHIAKGSEYPVNQDNSILGLADDEISIQVLTAYANNIINVDSGYVQLFIKVIRPIFKIGDVVFNTQSRILGAFRIYSYGIVAGRIWYRDGWSEATGCESGVHEENLRLATPKEAEGWEVEYNDSLVRDKKSKKKIK